MQHPSPGVHLFHISRAGPGQTQRAEEYFILQTGEDVLPSHSRSALRQIDERPLNLGVQPHTLGREEPTQGQGSDRYKAAPHGPGKARPGPGGSKLKALKKHELQSSPDRRRVREVY